MVVRTVGFLVVRRALGLVGLGPAPDAKDVEIAVLRHQLAVLRRQVARPRYTPTDRLVLATLAKLLPRQRWPVFLFTPSTLLRWHRELVRRHWTYPRAPRRDPRALPELVLKLATENLYRAKIRCMAVTWGFVLGQAARRYSLMTPPSTWCRRIGASSEMTRAGSWLGGRWVRPWWGRWSLKCRANSPSTCAAWRSW